MTSFADARSTTSEFARPFNAGGSGVAGGGTGLTYTAPMLQQAGEAVDGGLYVALGTTSTGMTVTSTGIVCLCVCV
jgi:hypothetical protein